MRKIGKFHGKYVFSQILIVLSFSFFWVSDLRFSKMKRLRDDDSS